MKDYNEWVQEIIDEEIADYIEAPDKLRTPFSYPVDGTCPKCGRTDANVSLKKEEFHCYVCGTYLWNRRPTLEECAKEGRGRVIARDYDEQSCQVLEEL